MSKHHVTTHHWSDGQLETVFFEFENFEEAVAFAENSDRDCVKIYDADGQLLDSVFNSPEPAATGTYA